MSDRELVEALQAGKDDLEAWGDPEGPAPSTRTSRRKSEKRQRTAVVSVRLTSDELATLQSRADAAGQPISGYLRQLATSSGEGEATKVRHRRSMVQSTAVSDARAHRTATVVSNFAQRGSWVLGG